MNVSPITAQPTRMLEIELLALDLNACTRCVSSWANLQQAIALLQEILNAIGVSVTVRQSLIESEAQARQRQFVTSPTIRINGADMALETLESQCDDCTDLCGCDGKVTCRVWRYQGKDYTAAPVGMIVDAVLREIYVEAQHPSPSAAASYQEVPDNLRQFFNGKAIQPSVCCSVSQQASCCEPEAKEVCCEAFETPLTTCGCQ